VVRAAPKPPEVVRGGASRAQSAIKRPVWNCAPSQRPYRRAGGPSSSHPARRVSRTVPLQRPHSAVRAGGAQSSRGAAGFSAAAATVLWYTAAPRWERSGCRSVRGGPSGSRVLFYRCAASPAQSPSRVAGWLPHSDQRRPEASPPVGSVLTRSSGTSMYNAPSLAFGPPGVPYGAASAPSLSQS
jgi:hypothetical protein